MIMAAILSIVVIVFAAALAVSHDLRTPRKF